MAAEAVVDTLALIFLNPRVFVLLILGTLTGLILGAIPGIGATLTLALLIPLTFGIDPTIAFMIFIAAKGGTTFGGSISSILINTPGGAGNAATLLDGYPMSQKGNASQALSASAFSSMFGAIIGVIFLALSIPILLKLIILFGPSEIFWLGIWGIVMVATVVRGKVLLGLISGVLGSVMALHGPHQLTATYRLTYDTLLLRDGFKLVPAIIGLFAISEMIILLTERKQIAEGKEISEIVGNRFSGYRDILNNKLLFLRSAMIGIIIGVIPGIGALAATYIAYYQAVHTADDPDSFGEGDVRGVIAPEAANDAKDGAALIPTLGFGIPGSASFAVLLGAFLFHGINPGPLLISNHFDIVVMIIVTLLLSNILTSVIGLAAINQIVRITIIDTRLLAPIILGIGFLGTFALNNNILDLYLTMFFGILGYIMLELNMSRIPMVLGLILIPIVESNFFRALQVSQGSYLVFIESPISILLIILIISGPLIPIIKQKVSNI